MFIDKLKVEDKTLSLSSTETVALFFLFIKSVVTLN
jgi:hypothetical protein